jgi:hypothetical protein
MKVHETRVRPPRCDGLANASIIERRRSTEPSREPLLRAHIVAREHVQTAETAQHDVLRRPSADASQRLQVRAHGRIVFAGQRLEVDVSSFDAARERQERADLLSTEAEGLKRRSPPPGEIARGGNGC